mgnify:CR=1 FL=1
MKIEINEYLLKLFHLVKDLGDIDFFWGRAKLSRTEFRILWEVANEQCMGRDIISSELARRIGITRSAVSQIVAKLEKNGIVKRIGSTFDRKIAYIRLTDEATETFLQQAQQANEFAERVLAEFGKERLDKLLEESRVFAETCERLAHPAKAEQ